MGAHDGVRAEVFHVAVDRADEAAGERAADADVGVLEAEGVLEPEAPGTDAGVAARVGAAHVHHRRAHADDRMDGSTLVEVERDLAAVLADGIAGGRALAVARSLAAHPRCVDATADRAG